MPVPLPGADALTRPPDHDEVIAKARAVVSAVRGAGALTDTQRYLLCANFEAMSGVHLDVDALEPLGPTEFAECMRLRDEPFRIRIVQTMLLAAFVESPLTEDVVDRIRAYAHELSVDDGMLEIADELAHGTRALAFADFERAGYHAHLDDRWKDVLHVEVPLHDDWQSVEDDPVLSARWAAMGELPPGTLGRGVWEFYRARGFDFPGSPGSAPPLLAQHDWMHVIADYGSTVESEIEVFGLVSRADDDPRAFSLLAMVLSLFETGMLHSATIFEYNPKHLSHDARRMSIRLADAMRRGAVIDEHFKGRDLLTVDWLDLADRPVTEIREMIGIPPKSPEAIAAGSIGPWEAGGISSFQLNMGRTAAEARGDAYESYGASVLDDPTGS